MALILRIDVDKPYGRSTTFDKIKSKLTEDFYFPKISSLGYLKATEEFIKFCNLNKVKGTFYFRNCTIPNQKVIRSIKEGGHKIGFHAENTRSFKTFKKELEYFERRIGNLNIHSFTKHGSGVIKIGRKHYPPYEPEKYKEWAKSLDIVFSFGNGICESKQDFENIHAFYPKMFWIHKDYRKESFHNLEDVIAVTSYTDVPVIIHPSNFTAEDHVNSEFKNLVSLADRNSIPWKV